MTQHAAGSFEVRLTPQALAHAAADPGLARLALDKTYSGELQGESSGEMLSFRSATPGSAGYVAIEHFQGSLAGRPGSFVLQHSSTLTRGTPAQNIQVVPDSGTGELRGLSGRMEIDIVEGRHFYRFAYCFEG